MVILTVLKKMGMVKYLRGKSRLFFILFFFTQLED